MSRAFATVVLSILVASYAMPARAIDLNPLSAIKGMVEAAVEDRSASDIKTDLEIKSRIVANVIDKMGSDVISINADVYEQNVMLTGIVEEAAQRVQAGALTKAIDGVKNIYNEILVIKKLDRDKGAVEGFVDDTVIETKINALLLDANGVNVTNFRWRSVGGGKVFLFGRALSRGEHTKALSIVEGIENVSSVVSHVKIRPKS